MERKLCIIPARGGSKRIPRKNIKDFLGKPIIAYSIEAAINSGIFDEVMVSTDDQEIAEISMKYGAKVPFLRSTENANDFATTFDVINETLEAYKNLNQIFEYTCCIYACAPFVNEDILNESFLKLKEEGLDTIFPIVLFSFPIQRALILNDKLEFREPEHELTRSQDLTPTYHDVGQFYFMKTNVILKQKKIIGSNTSGIIVDEFSSQDIDTIADWKIAEMKFNLLNNE
jgi:pseudaminic acid cytidylyltransferase